jgi:hypothetical protein
LENLSAEKRRDAPGGERDLSLLGLSFTMHVPNGQTLLQGKQQTKAHAFKTVPLPEILVLKS